MAKTIALTGHRPNKLWGYKLDEPHYGNVAHAVKRFIDENDVDTLISGMALGFDQLGARVALEWDTKLIAAVPFKGQESQWPAHSQKTYSNILDAADEVVVVCEGEYAPYKMQKRNEWMVDHADIILALWDGTSGGTANCVSYALKQGKPIYRLDPKTVDDAPAKFQLYEG